MEAKKRGPKKRTEPNEKELDMRDMYISGKTLQEIGDKYLVTRERVRQLLKKFFGITRKDGGICIASIPKKIETACRKKRIAENKELRIARVFGCSMELFLNINGGEFYRKNYGEKATVYYCQKRNAIRYKHNWNITFPEWWKIWEESGKWEEHGRGKYCMSRIGNTGPYEVGNVEIKLMGEVARDSYLKTPASIRAEKARITRASKLDAK